MRLLHVPFCYYPDAAGGTEVYVASLARAQRARGHEVLIAAPDSESRDYLHDGFDVHRFATGGTVTLNELYGDGDPEAAANFLKVLECTRPDILHLHALTSGVSVALARGARARGIPVVLTYHTPVVTCLRGTMMRWGRTPCDGEMRVSRCVSCMLHARGIPPLAGWVLGNMPAGVGALAGAAGLSGGLWTAFRASQLVGLRHATLRRFLISETDHIVAVCRWVRDVLLANSVPAEKITLSRQAIPYPAGAANVAERERLPVRFAFFGRLDAVKGVHVLLDAFLAAPQLDVRLDVFAVVQTEEGRSIRQRLLGKIGGDQRIRFLPPVPATEVVERLRSYDALMVPSQWLETGPLVVYEAFAAGIPVVGSALGGIAELVTDGENGLLVPAASVAGWTQAITRLVHDQDLLGRLKASPKPMRTADDIASDADEVYAKVMKARA